MNMNQAKAVPEMKTKKEDEGQEEKRRVLIEVAQLAASANRNGKLVKVYSTQMSA